MVAVNLKSWSAVFLKLFLGTIYYQIMKMINDTCGYSIDYDDSVITINSASLKNKCPDGQSPFRKTFFGPTVVFSSMVFALVHFAVFRRKTADPKTYNRKMVLLMGIPSTLECVALVISTYAQSIMSLSFSMILKGAKVVFSAIFTVTFLHRKQYAYHWASVAFCLAGLVVAGTSEYLNAITDPGFLILGVCLSLGGELMKAFRVIYDEKMLKSHRCDTLFVVGMEGLYSMVILIPTVFIVWLLVSGNDDGSFESLPDSFHRIQNSGMLKGLFIALPFVVVVLAIAGMMIIKYLSGVHNALISVARSIAVWVFELVFHYAAPDALSKQYGKPWGTYCPLKLVGFIMVIIATLVYDGTLKLPMLFYYPPADKKKDSIDHENTHADDSFKLVDSPTGKDNFVVVKNDDVMMTETEQKFRNEKQ